MRNYDRQVILHLGVPDQGTPKVKWDFHRDPNQNTNIDITDPNDKAAKRNAVAALTNQSRVYIVGHGVEGEQYKIFKSKTESVHYSEIVKYIGENARDASLRQMQDPVLRISMVVCLAASTQMPGLLHQELLTKHGIYSEVLARHDEVWVNQKHGIKFAVHKDPHTKVKKRVDGRAPKVLIRFQGNKQIREDAYVEEVDHQSWNFEAVESMRQLELEEFGDAVEDNQRNVDRYHVKVANKLLLDALQGAKLKIPNSVENEATLKTIDDLIASYPPP